MANVNSLIHADIEMPWDAEEKDNAKYIYVIIRVDQPDPTEE